MPKAIDITDCRFGRLVAMQLASKVGKKRRWLCQCDCGKQSLAHQYDLIRGKHLSCGCLQKEAATRHGLWSTHRDEYRIWTAMKQRCNNPRMINYGYYGGRGIKVCDTWANFANFIADMGKKPSPLHTIDRINGDGDYEPGNCRWATRKEQAQNRTWSPPCVPRQRNSLGQFC